MGAAVADRKPVILCVDDELIPLTLRRSVLQRAGYEVLAASSGTEALEVLATEPVDLVLTDLLMPGLSGTELAREIRKRIPDVPIVLFSGVNELPDDASHADLFISKVEGPAVMCQKIAEMLGRVQQP
jgi:CheY-like chemotaxis protein